MTEFFKVNDRKQTTDPGSSDYTKPKNKTKQKVSPRRHIIFKVKKNQRQENILKDTGGDGKTSYREAKIRISLEIS